MNINEAVQEAYTNAVKKGWHQEKRSIGDMVALMHSELSEALEEHRKGKLPNEIYFNEIKTEKPEGIPVELADCVIRIFDFCGLHNIDLEAVIKQKMAYNNTRSFRHGNKTI